MNLRKAFKNLQHENTHTQKQYYLYGHASVFMLNSLCRLSKEKLNKCNVVCLGNPKSDNSRHKQINPVQFILLKNVLKSPATPTPEN